MTRKRYNDDQVVNMNEVKENIRILDLTSEYIRKMREIQLESV